MAEVLIAGSSMPIGAGECSSLARTLYVATVGIAPRWFTETGPGHSQRYIERFRRLAREGHDLVGEARLLDAMVAPQSRILDAGCGTGRIGGELAARGHFVVGVDIDPALIASARADHPGPTWLVEDLCELDLAVMGQGEPFAAAVMAGNVMSFVAPGSEGLVLSRVGSHVRVDGIVVVGFGTDGEYSLDDFDSDIEASGLVLEHRFSTWDLRSWSADAGFAVSVLRRPSIAS
jgi:SAM-dependent methyltransferase